MIKTFYDLFAGIGGFHIAASNNKLQCVGASEINKHSKLVYHQNFGIMPQGDIKTIKDKDIPKHDILFAGFSCKPYSDMNKTKLVREMHNKGDMFLEILRVLKLRMPKVFLLENVVGLLKANNAILFEFMLQALAILGYNIFHERIKAWNFGTPQRRERVYIVGFRTDLQIKTFMFPTGERTTLSIYSLLSKSYTERDLVPAGWIKYFNNHWEKLLHKGYVKIDAAITLIARMYISWQGGYILVNREYDGGKLDPVNDTVRHYTADELLRLQTFPETFKVHPKKWEMYKQFGNTIVVNVADAIIQEILKVYDDALTKTLVELVKK